MPVIPNHLLRLAVSIRAGLVARHGRERVLELPNWSWDRCAHTVRQIRRAELRGWNLAAEVLRRDLASMIRPLVTELTDLSQRVVRARTIDKLSSTREIYRDL